MYLNRDAMNPETPLHEYTHLWDDMVRRENPELWERGKEQQRSTIISQETSKRELRFNAAMSRGRADFDALREREAQA